jgi:hypothetical protein
MKKKIFVYIMTIIMMCVFSLNISAWMEPTHELYSVAAILKSKLCTSDLLKRLNFERQIYFEMFKYGSKIMSLRKWVQYGANHEDDALAADVIGARANNHFHNPLLPWDQAGLTDISSGSTESLLLWAQDGPWQSTYVQGDNSWNAARNYYYQALTSTVDQVRQEYFARTFKALGHQMHLIQDSSVPDHVRNDSHPLNSSWFWKTKYGIWRCIENWAAHNVSFVQELASGTPLVPAVNLNLSITHNGLPMAPITQLADTDIYTGGNPGVATGLNLGLAEYTNPNFFSEDTIFTSPEDDFDAPAIHRFPYPKVSGTNLQELIDSNLLPEEITAEDGLKDQILYVRKTGDGETDFRLLAAGYLEKYVRELRDITPDRFKTYYRRTFYHDNNCYRDYMTMLVPRAVGYSIRFLDYFFRGEIEVTLPEDGIYAITDEAQNGFSKIKLRARNITQDEDMLEGSVSLMVRYRLINGDPFKNTPPVQDKTQYYIKGEPLDPVSGIPSNDPVEIEFDLSTPLPLNATDITLQVIYKGLIGHEIADENAVALGFKDISEPTPVNIYNDMDRICLYNTWYQTGSPGAVAVVDKNGNGIADVGEWDVYPKLFSHVYFNFTGDLSAPNADLYEKGSIYPGETHRIFVLAENSGYIFSVRISNFINMVPEDKWIAYYVPENKPQKALKNRLKWLGYNPSTGEDMYGREIYPVFIDYRGIQLWGGLVVVSSPYPEDSQCPGSIFAGISSEGSSGSHAIEKNREKLRLFTEKVKGPVNAHAVRSAIPQKKIKEKKQP